MDEWRGKVFSFYQNPGDSQSHTLTLSHLPLNQSLTNTIPQSLQTAESRFPPPLVRPRQSACRGLDAIIVAVIVGGLGEVEVGDEPVGHGHHFDQEEVEAGGVEKGGMGVGGVVRGEGGLEGHRGVLGKVG